MMQQSLNVLPPYLSAGGADMVDRLVESFYRRMDALPEARAIRHMHSADLADTKAVSKLYFTEWLGGPPNYSQRTCHPRLWMRHMRFPIGPAERDAWLACMSGALDEAVADPKRRERLLAALTKTTD